VLTVEGTHGPVIHAVTRAAAERGARAGARLTDARALDPALVAVEADPTGDEALVRRLARRAGRWSPLVEVDGDGLRLDIGGVAHLFGGEAALVADVRERFARMGLSSRVAVAPTPGAAWALSRYGDSPTIVAPAKAGAQAKDNATLRRCLDPSLRWDDSKGLAAALAPLPVAALRLSPPAVRTLERLGLKTIEELSGIERRSLARRFREADNPVDALDRALGRKPEPLTGTRVEPPPQSVLRLAEPVADPAILRQALARLADPLAEELARRRLGARRIAFSAFRVDGEVGEAAAETALPTRDAAHIVRLLGEKVEGLDLGFGFDGFALTATWCEPLDVAQDALLGEPPAELELARLIDRLVSRLGADRVRRPVARESHLPEVASGWGFPSLSREGPRGGWRMSRLDAGEEASSCALSLSEAPHPCARPLKGRGRLLGRLAEFPAVAREPHQVRQFERAPVVGLDADPPHRLAVAAVGEDDRRRAVAPLLAPLPERDYHRQQRLALVGQRIDHLAAVRLVLRALEDSARDQLGETVGQDVARDSEARLELLEMLEAVERAAKDQERPFLTEQLDRVRQRAMQRRLAKGIEIPGRAVLRHATPQSAGEKSTNIARKIVAIENCSPYKLRIATQKGRLP
jgi:protein ImuB